MNRVSIIMPNYNHAHFLPEAINSVLGQTHKNWDLIIVDDGSNDNSIGIIDQYIKKFPSRISRYIHPTGRHKGLLETYRLGFKKATSEFIAFLEADDIWFSDNLKRKLEFFKKFENAILVYSEVELFGDPELYTCTKKWIESVSVSIENTPFIALQYLMQRQIIPTFSSAVVRNLPGVIKNFDFSKKHTAWLDWWLWTQLSLEGKFIFIPEKLVKWRKHHESFNAKFVEGMEDPRTGCSQYTDIFLCDLHSLILHKLKQKNNVILPATSTRNRTLSNYKKPVLGGYPEMPQRSHNINHVSIIMPNYNLAHFLPEAINSILNQTYENWDLIIIDDGSTDNSIEIIDQYVKKFPSRISLYIHPAGCHKGLAETYKLGFQKANSQFISFLEADDFWRPDNLSSRMALFRKFNNVVLVYSDVELSGNLDLAKLKKIWLDSLPTPPSQKPFSPISDLITQNIIPTFSTVIIRNPLPEFSFPDFTKKPEVWLDWQLWLQLSLEGEFAYIPEKLVFWRMTENSYNAKFVKSLKNYENYFDTFLLGICESIKNRLKNKKWHFAFHLLEKIMNANISMKSKRNEYKNLISRHNQIFKEKCDEFALLPDLRNAKLKELKENHHRHRSKLEDTIRKLAQKDGLSDWHLKIKDNKLGHTYDRLNRKIEKMEEKLKTARRGLNHFNNFSSDKKFSIIDNLLREKTTESEKLMSAISRKALEVDTECNILKETISIKDRAFATMCRIYEIKKYELSDEITRYDQVRRKLTEHALDFYFTESFMNPKVSILMPVYNQISFLDTAIDSALNQSYSEKELLIIDDGSSDGSFELAQKYSRKYPGKIKLLHHHKRINMNLNSTYRLGFRHATGELIAFLEGDDIWSPDSLESKVNIFNKHDNVVLVYSSVQPFGDLSAILKKKFWLAGIKQSPSNQPFYALHRLMKDNIIPTFSATMIRNPVFDIIFPEKPIVWLDWWIWSQIALYGEFFFLQDKKTYWRVHNASYNSIFLDSLPDASAYHSSFVNDLKKLILEKTSTDTDNIAPEALLPEVCRFSIFKRLKILLNSIIFQFLLRYTLRTFRNVIRNLKISQKPVI